MKRHFLILVIVVASLLAPVGAVAAQEATNQTASSTTEEPTGSTQTIELSPTTQITEWRFANGTFYVTIKAAAPTRLAITDAGKLSQILSEGDGAAAGKARVRRMTMTPGTTTVEFRAESFGGASAITITSSNADGIVAIRSDAMQAAKDAIEWSSAGMLIVGAAAGAGWFSYRRMKKRLEKMNEEVKRII